MTKQRDDYKKWNKGETSDMNPGRLTKLREIDFVFEKLNRRGSVDTGSSKSETEEFDSEEAENFSGVEQSGRDGIAAAATRHDNSPNINFSDRSLGINDEGCKTPSPCASLIYVGTCNKGVLISDSNFIHGHSSRAVQQHHPMEFDASSIGDICRIATEAV